MDGFCGTLDNGWVVSIAREVKKCRGRNRALLIKLLFSSFLNFDTNVITNIDTLNKESVSSLLQILLHRQRGTGNRNNNRTTLNLKLKQYSGPL